MMLKPYDTLEDTTAEIRGFDLIKPEMLIWRCTTEQAIDIPKIIEMVKAQGYTMFEIREITEVNKFYDINDVIAE